MQASTRLGRLSRGYCFRIPSLLVLLALFVCPLLTALPVHADWGPDTLLTSSVGVGQPKVAASGDSVHVSWADARDGNPEVYYKRSTDGGATWGPDTRLTNAPGDSIQVSIAASGVVVHIFWADSRDGSYQIFYKRSADGGATWSADRRLTGPALNSFEPSAAVAGSLVLVGYHTNDVGGIRIHSMRSTDGGATWGADVTVSHGASDVGPALGVSGNDAHAVWQGFVGGTLTTLYNRSRDGGATWGATDTPLTTTFSIQPRIAVSGEAVHVAWIDNRNAKFQIFYKHSLDGGGTWGADVLIAGDAPLSTLPAVAADGSNVHIVWLDNRAGNFEVFYRRSMDSGASWGNEMKLTTGARPDDTVMANMGNNLHVVWLDLRDFPPRVQVRYERFTTAPVVTSVDPGQGRQGQTIDDVVIRGANFTGSTGVSFGEGVTTNRFTVDSDRRITVSITVAASAGLGLRDVAVSGPTATGRHREGFSVLSGASVADRPHSSTVPSSTQGPVSLPSISVKSASLSAARVAPGTPLTVTANLANTGAVNGAMRIPLYVNGQEESAQGVTVQSGATSSITFCVSRSEPGAYTVRVGGTDAGSFTVDQFADPAIFALGAGILFMIIFAAGVIVYRRK